MAGRRAPNCQSAILLGEEKNSKNVQQHKKNYVTFFFFSTKKILHLPRKYANHFLNLDNSILYLFGGTLMRE